MYKCIITDMDGSLLNSQKELPSDLYEVIDDCIDKGIEFAIGSGRSYSNLVFMFESIKDKISFICDNGAYVISKNKVLYTSAIPTDKVEFFVKEGRKDSQVITILCTTTTSYFENYDTISEEAMDEIMHFYPNCTNVDDLLHINEDVLKICYLDLRGAENTIYQQLLPYSSDPRVVLSAAVWVDVVNLDVNKGLGVEKLQNEFDCTHADTVVFGDYLNDLEMFQQATTSYAPSNAHEDIKELATEVIGHHDDWSIITKIKELIGYEKNSR